MSKRTIIVITIAIFILPLCNAIGGNYKLLKLYPTGIHEQMFEVAQEDMDVCKAYEKNLNLFQSTPHPMVCERPISPNSKGFIKPNWKSLDIKKYKEIVKKMDRLAIYYKGNPKEFNEEQWEKMFKNRADRGKIHLHYAKFDIDTKKYGDMAKRNEKSQVSILQYSFGANCDPNDIQFYEWNNGVEYFMTDENISDIKDIVGTGSLRGVFAYHGEVYFDAFSYSDWSDWFKKQLKERQYEVWLYKLVSLSAGPSRVPICRFRYIGNVPVGKPLEK